MRAAPNAAPQTGLRRRLNVLVVLGCIAFALLATWTHGADVNWDLRNYHVYSGFAFAQGRLSSEFMAAGLMSYLNPLPMLPFYGMLAAGWHSLAIGIVLGLYHAVNLVLLWMICRRLFGELPWGRSLALLALLTGAASPIFIAEISTSYADIFTCAPVLGGVLLLLGAPTRGRFLAGGALLGAAVGLKLTNLPFAVAALAFVFTPGTSWRQRGANLGWLVLGGLAGGVLTGGWWAWMLYREFGNPVFPFVNSLFHSPDFPAVGHIHRRFLPRSLLDALAFPFYIAIPKIDVYTESVAADFRFALCALAGAAAFAAALLGRGMRGAGAAPDGAPWPRFLGYVALGWTLWLIQFANGRYFLPLTLLVGPALVGLLAMFLPARRALQAAAVCAVVQFGQMTIAGVESFGGTGKWGASWINLDVPAKLVERPHLFLSLDIQSNSYLAPFVHRDARFMNVNGMVPLDLDGPGGERVRRQLARFAGATRMLTPIFSSVGYALASPTLVPSLDADLNRFGLRVDTGDCVTIANLDLPQGISALEPGETASNKARRAATILSCALVPAAPDPVLQAGRARAARVFDAIERACPAQFPARWNGVVVRSRTNLSWNRFYVDTDLWLMANDKRVFAQHRLIGAQPLGTPDGLLAGTERVPCERIRWYASPTLSLDPVSDAPHETGEPLHRKP